VHSSRWRGKPSPALLRWTNQNGAQFNTNPW